MIYILDERVNKNNWAIVDEEKNLSSFDEVLKLLYVNSFPKFNNAELYSVELNIIDIAIILIMDSDEVVQRLDKLNKEFIKIKGIKALIPSTLKLKKMY